MVYGKVNSTLQGLSNRLAFKSRKWYFTTLARILIVSTFIEDGIRLIWEAEDQAQYLFQQWPNLGTPLIKFAFVYPCGLIQLIISSVIICRAGRLVLSSVVLIVCTTTQVIMYQIFDEATVVRSLGICGGLVILISSQTQPGGATSIPGNLLESATWCQDKARTATLLGGRVLCAILFIELLEYSSSPVVLVLNGVSIILMLLMVVGWMARLSALMSTMAVLLLNCWLYPWWNAGSYDVLDYRKFYFFQVLSVTGGMLLSISTGPGDLSVDEYMVKKKQ